MTPNSRLGRPQSAPALFRLLAESALSRAALDACGAPVALLGASSPKLAVCYVNAAFTAFFGFAEGEAIGKSIAALLWRGDEAVLQRALTDSPSAWPLTAWRKDGAALQVELALRGVRGADGGLTHWVLTFSDRSEVERLRAEVESLRSLGPRLGAGSRASALPT